MKKIVVTLLILIMAGSLVVSCAQGEVAKAVTITATTAGQMTAATVTNAQTIIPTITTTQPLTTTQTITKVPASTAEPLVQEISEEEEMSVEYNNVQIAVTALIVNANVIQLDSNHNDVNTLDEVHAVTAGDPCVHLGLYLLGIKFPLKQAYDIAIDGEVTVHNLS